MDFKQVILVRTDLKLPKGKLAAQVGHACVEAALKASKKDVSTWRSNGSKKVILKVKSKKELFEFKDFFEQAGIPVAVITDAGKTVIAPGTVTCMGVGPAIEEDIDEISGDLPLV